MRTKAGWLTLIVLFVAAAPAAAAECPHQARCAQITVPLDHSGKTAGSLPLTYAVLPATGPRTGTIMFLTGGPGQSAIPYTDRARPLLEPLRRTNDIVMVDQRGTGGSGSTHCDSARGCARKLGVKRAFLTTEETARDLEDLRVALGVERITPLGVSYGTKVAGEYARRFPEHTAAVVLDSAVGVDGIDLLGLNAIEAMPRMLREVCALDPCASTVKDAGAALFGAVDRVRRKPVRVSLAGSDGDTSSVSLNDGQLFEIVQLADTDPALAADLPAALASLAHGDAAPLFHAFLRELELAFDADPGAPDDEEPDEDTFASFSRYLATLCLEMRLPWSPASAPSTRDDAVRAYLAGLGSRPFAPFRARVVLQHSPAALCHDWPATPPPEPVPLAGPNVPVLILSGGEDLRTPTEDAQRIAATYPNATLLKVPYVGHSVLTAEAGHCARDAVTAFLAGTPPAPCTGSAPRLAPAAYVPRTVPNLKTAVQVTIDGIRHDLEAVKLAVGSDRRASLSGLRHGHISRVFGRLRLREVEWARGVRVSGTLSETGNGRLTARGRTLVVQGFMVR